MENSVWFQELSHGQWTIRAKRNMSGNILQSYRTKFINWSGSLTSTQIQNWPNFLDSQKGKANVNQSPWLLLQLLQRPPPDHTSCCNKWNGELSVYQNDFFPRQIFSIPHWHPCQEHSNLHDGIVGTTTSKRWIHDCPGIVQQRSVNKWYASITVNSCQKLLSGVQNIGHHHWLIPGCSFCCFRTCCIENGEKTKLKRSYLLGKVTSTWAFRER